MSHDCFRKCFAIFLGLSLLFVLSCREEPPKEAPKEPVKRLTLERIPFEKIPSFVDDLDDASLRSAIGQSLTYYSRIPQDRTFSLGELEVQAGLLKDTLIHFLDLLDAGRLNRDAIARSFDVYGVRDTESSHGLLLTGYYEPILDGRLERDEEFRYPLYGIPPDLLTIDLAAFNPERYAGERLVARVVENRVVPYYTRAEIDGQKMIENCGLQMVWLRDLLDVFFLHVQGSGMIRLPGGKFARVGYAGSNGRPYRSIGKYLIDKGVMTSEGMSLQALRSYLNDHPDVAEEVLWHNESYVFFRWVQDGPLGSINVRLTAGRSIATDPRIYPRGGLAFLESEKPRLDAQGRVAGWEPMHRWVLNQDAGGAIKGTGRADLFCGSGEAAEWVAGRLKHPGTLYFFLKKETGQKE